MNKHANTLYVTTPNSYVDLDHLCLEIRSDLGKKQVPLHHLSAVVLIGYQSISPFAMEACANRGISVAFLTERGRFLARVEGRISTNVLVRRMHYRIADDELQKIEYSRVFVASKIANTKAYLRQCARDNNLISDKLTSTADSLNDCLKRLKNTITLNSVRGIEGEAAAKYFSNFPLLIKNKIIASSFLGRTRRPPKDPFNALLSFLYVILINDVRSALEVVGLDSQVGFLHVDRPGKPSLALDMIEEFRIPLADRLAFSLINKKQITEKDFTKEPLGGVLIKDEARKKILMEYQERKLREFIHPYTKETISYALLPLIQARLLSRTIRGEIEQYPAYIETL